MSVLLSILNEPARLRDLSGEEWDALLRQARSSFLMGHLTSKAADSELISSAPEIARYHMHAGKVLCAKIETDIRRELGRLGDALAGFGGPVVLLKGAAYLSAGLPAARNRMFGDIDLLVRKTDIELAERLLNAAGWSTAGTDPYDDDYYRRWTHELPPMEHIDRGSIIDLHHAVVQERRLSPFDRDTMIECARHLDDVYSILQPLDMVLHSCVHLFNDGEFDKGLRDLVDLVTLIRHFDECEPDFRSNLAIRAAELDFSRQLYFGMRYGHLMLGLENPHGYLDAIRPDGVNDRLMDALFMSALQPDHPTAASRWTATARKALYYRGHYLRMPFRHLIPHLIRKAVMPEAPHPAMQPMRPVQEG